MDNTQRMRRAIERHQAGDLAEAGRLYKEILDRDPRHSEAWHLSGVIAHQLGRDVEALQLIEHAIGICHDMAVYHANLATVHFSRGDAERAVEACRRALEIDSANAQAMNLLGGLMLDEADRKPAHDKSGREALQAEADRLLTQAARLAPRMADAWSNLCRLHAVRREWDRAEAAGRRAIGLAPRNFQAIRHLAAVLARQSKPEEAARLYEQAIEVRPDVADVRFNFAEMLGQLGRLADAERAYIAAIERDPRHVAAWNNLGHLYMERGGTEQGIACYRRVLEIDPHHTHVRSNYLGALMISGTTTPNELADAHREAGRMMEARATRPIAPTGGVSPRSPIGGGPIRIGYVSPDFRNHAMTSFFEPMLAGHDRQSFAVHCYSSVARPDEVTRRLQSQADAWRDIHLLSDDEAADLVRSDRIDLLVDLAGHTGNHRLGVFARRAAPVQATMLGYMLTTGLASVDAYISDSTRNPP